MHLSDLKEGESGVIGTVSAPHEMARRLNETGFTRGERVTCIRKAILGGPILFEVKGAKMALRRCDSDKVGVEYE